MVANCCKANLSTHHIMQWVQSILIEHDSPAKVFLYSFPLNFSIYFVQFTASTQHYVPSWLYTCTCLNLSNALPGPTYSLAWQMHSRLIWYLPVVAFVVLTVSGRMLSPQRQLLCSCCNSTDKRGQMSSRYKVISNITNYITPHPHLWSLLI